MEFNGYDEIKIIKRKTESINVKDVMYKWFCVTRVKNFSS